MRLAARFEWEIVARPFTLPREIFLPTNRSTLIQLVSRKDDGNSGGASVARCGKMLIHSRLPGWINFSGGDSDGLFAVPVGVVPLVVRPIVTAPRIASDRNEA